MNETPQTEISKKTHPNSDYFLNKLELVMTQIDVVRFWFTRSWRIGMMMAKGGYLTSERKKLFRRLGEEAFYQMQKGDMSLSDLVPLTQEIKDLTKKIEIQELLIRRLRFGTSYQKKINPEALQEPKIS
ncbi:MAG: hypothetical protein EBR01_08635 [Proteobacteria bacterium]|nr:hypothetical protein [Pseudomonadota bacterium]NBY19567.1 hypothetical protein [bacterium]